MRVFTGIPLPPECKDRLRKAIHRHREFCPGLRWIQPQGAHITLKFLGEVADERLPEVLDCLREIRFAPFALRLGGVGFFPEKGPPKVLWLGLAQGQKEISELAAQVENMLAPLGFKPDKKKYRPHLTLARVKNAQDGSGGRSRMCRSAQGWDGLFKALQSEVWPETLAERAVAWQSRLTPAGPDYSALLEFGPVGE